MIDPDALKPNHSIQRMRASRLCQLRCERLWRLARTADGVAFGPHMSNGFQLIDLMSQAGAVRKLLDGKTDLAF